MDYHLNGQMVPAAEAMISADDAGFQHAVGLFETMQAQGGKVFRLTQHLQRLEASAQQLGLAESLDLSQLESAVEQTITHNQLDAARLRLTYTPGPLSLLRQETQSAPTPTVLVVPSPLTQYDPAYFDRGITAMIAQPAGNPFDPTAGHKTLAYWNRLYTLRRAAAAGAGEAIWLNVTHHLASGSISNLFLVKDGELLTPFARGEELEGALPAPVLPGVTRAAILELAQEQDIAVHKRMLSVDELLNADEVFLTNSSWNVLPVTKIEKSPVADEKVGPITQQLRSSLMLRIEAECRGE